MEQNTQQFNDFTDKLRSELSLLNDEEYQRKVLKIEGDKKAELVEIVLNEAELKFLNEALLCVSDEFWKEKGLHASYYTDTHLAIIQKENPEAIKDLVCKLFNSGHTPEYIGVPEEEQDYYQPIEELLDDLLFQLVLPFRDQIGVNFVLLAQLTQCQFLL